MGCDEQYDRVPRPQTKRVMHRKVIQIATAVIPHINTMSSKHITTVLCDDGTMWENENGGQWYEVSNVPQPDESN